MKRFFLQHGMIFFLSFLLGFLGLLQYSALKNNSEQFEENNPLRELRILFDANQEMKQSITETKTTLEGLSTQGEIIQNAQNKIQEARVFAGEVSSGEAALSLVVEGNIDIQTMKNLINTLWNVGVTNIEINGARLSASNSGFDTAGGQILVGSIPLTAPYIFNLYGNANNLLQVLDTEKGALQRFKSNERILTLSALDANE